MKNSIFLLMILLAVAPLGASRNRDSEPALSGLLSTAQIRLNSHDPSQLSIQFSSPSEMDVQAFMDACRVSFNLSSVDELKLYRSQSDVTGQKNYRFKQFYKGFELAETQFLVHEKNGSVSYAHGLIIQNLKVDTHPALSESEALIFALNRIDAQQYIWQTDMGQTNQAAPSGKLMLSAGFAGKTAANFKLVYRFDIYSIFPFGRYNVDVDAHSGAIVSVIPTLYTENYSAQGISRYNGRVPFMLSDTVLTGDSHIQLPYQLQTPKSGDRLQVKYMFRESGRGNGIKTLNMHNTRLYSQTTDFITPSVFVRDNKLKTAVSVHWAMEAAFDYFLTRHQHEGFDGNGAGVTAYVHFGTNVSNAYWDGRRILLGDGNGLDFNPFVSLDVVGHEFTHGVTHNSSGLYYFGESGALNESFSDIFGTLIEFYADSTGGDWLLGEDFTLFQYALRSMENPKDLNMPDTYEGEYWASTSSPNDYGGVHTNSSVQNYWFYLLAEGGSGINDKGFSYLVNGIGIDDAAQIAYRALTVYIVPVSNFRTARLASLHAAGDLFGYSSAQYQAVSNAWNAVGVYSPFIGPYATECSLDQTFLRPKLDTLKMSSNIVSSTAQPGEVNAIIESFDRQFRDTIALAPKTLISDSQSIDYAGSWPAVDEEKNYNVHIQTIEPDSGYNNILYNAATFTTVGPVIFYEAYSQLDDNELVFVLALKNESLTATAEDIRVHIEAMDSSVVSISGNDQSFGDISAGEIAVSPGFYSVTLSRPESAISFFASISGNGNEYWTSKFTIGSQTVSSISATNPLPLDYKLSQNAPNPFNPGTTIEFQIPKQEFVVLKIFNRLGQNVARLISKNLQAGNYKIYWHADGLASGIYIYQLQAGEFVQSKKMVLLR